MNNPQQDWKPIILKKKYSKTEKKKLMNQDKIKTQTVQKYTKTKDSQVKNIKLDKETDANKHTKVKKELSKKIQQARLKNKWTQDELAKKLNMPKSIINSYENGKAIPKPQEIIKIRRILKI